MGRGREFWRALSLEVDEGDFIADVARRHGVQPKTLAWWRWKLGSEARSAKRPLLLPVVIRAPQRSRAECAYIELHVGGVIIRIASGTDEHYVASLVAALRS